MAEYIKYKLKIIYRNIEKSGKNKFNSFEDFRTWALSNGYRPWKSINLLFEEDGYSEENCSWGLDKKGKGKPVSILEDKSTDNVVKTVKCMACSVMDARLLLQQLEGVCDEMLASDTVDKAVCRDLKKNLSAVNVNLLDAFNNIDKLRIYGVEE